MVSIKDIANECGVSIATVSKALNNHKDVSDATKKNVRETAKRLGYLPNSQARALKTKKTFNIGVLLVDEAEKGIEHSYFSAVLNSFKKEAESFGYDITLISSNIGNMYINYYEHCVYRNFDGVFIVCGDFYSENIISLLESSLPLVTLDCATGKKLSVISDNESGVSELVTHIHGKGHTKIAFIKGEVSDVTNARLSGYKKTLEKFGIPYREDYVLQGRYHDPITTEQLVKKLVALDDPPTCIMLPDDFSVLGALNAFEELGLSVPNDISIVGYDGILLTQIVRPKLTTVKQDNERLGLEAARLLISLIRREIPEDAPPVIIPGHLVEGESVKDLTKTVS